MNARGSSERHRGSLPRKVSQARLQFPATLEQVKDDLLAEVDENDNEDSYNAFNKSKSDVIVEKKDSFSEDE